MVLSGTAICLGEDIDTDLIIAGRYLRTKDRSLWAAHALKDLDPTLAARLSGTIIIAGNNFGCGSSREQAPVALKEAGVVAVVAPSFARIFFRNAINIGLPLLEADGVLCQEGAPVTVSVEEGWVETCGVRTKAAPLSERMTEILAAGGLVEYWRKRR